MSDDLVKRLSQASYLAFEDGTNDHGAPSEAAARIAELEAERDALAAEVLRLRAKVAAGEKLAEAMGQMRGGWANALELEIIAEGHRGTAKVLQLVAADALAAWEATP